MVFILLLLIILFIGGGGFLFLKSYDEKYVTLQKSNLLLKSQLSKMKEKYALIDLSTQDCTVEFLSVDNNFGILPKNTIIRISPTSYSCIINKLSSSIQVEILDKVRISDSIWYYILIPNNTNINSKGWVEECSFSKLFNSSSKELI